MLSLTNMPRATKPPVRPKRTKTEVQEEFEEIRTEAESARESADAKAQQAARLRAEGKFAEAEQRLKSLLAQNPADAGAAMMLMRLFAQDLRQPGRAHEVLRQLEKQPHVAASHLEFARRSIDEWSRPKPEKTEVAAPPESVEELLAQGFLGTAIERLEEQIKAQPQDFALRLKLAEIHAVRCKDFQRAEKMIRQMETSSIFSPPQTESARAKLKEWCAAAGNQHGMA